MVEERYLVHHGILGQKWGVRRYQNPDGTLTDAGKKRLNSYVENGELKKKGKKFENVIRKQLAVDDLTNENSDRHDVRNMPEKMKKYYLDIANKQLKDEMIKISDKDKIFINEILNNINKDWYSVMSFDELEEDKDDY